jgi:DNA-binding winged helix-turn-helix (wHTH) protein/tetratricopeptide (TPR) repeat protein
MARYRFDRFSVDERAAELWDGERLLHLQPKVHELLLLLLRRPRTVISREELNDTLWPDVHVGYSSLNQAISRLRAALGGGEELLQTLQKRGYRLAVEVVREEDQPQAPAPPRDASFVGRQALLAQLQARVAAPSYWVTLHGPGGIGKTRLARALMPQARWVELGRVHTPDELWRTLALAASVSLTESRDPAATLAKAMSGTAWVLDEVEGVAESVGELLSTMHSPQVLVTSRVLTGRPGELAVAVLPLSAPEARQLWQGLVPTDEGDPRELLARLDHHPLAIELAAARAPLLHVEGLLRRIEARGLASLDPSSTLAEIAETSWQAVSSEAQRCAALMAALPAPVLLEDLEVAEPGTDWLDPMDELRRCAWIRPDGAGWRIPEPLAEWLRAHTSVESVVRYRLAQSLVSAVQAGQKPELERLLWVMGLELPAEQRLVLAYAALGGLSRIGVSPRSQEVARQGASALESLQQPDPADAVRFEIELALHHKLSHKLPQALAVLDRAMARPAPPAQHARVWQMRGNVLGMMGRVEAAQEAAEALLAWAETQGEPAVLHQALDLAIQVRHRRSPYGHLVERGLEVARQLGDPQAVIWMRWYRARHLRENGQLLEAKLELEAIRPFAGSAFLSMDIETDLVNVLVALGAYREAHALCESLGDRAERAGVLRTALSARGNLAWLMRILEDPGAEAMMLRVLADAEQLGAPLHADTVRINLSELYWKRGELDKAVTLLEACRRPDTVRRLWNAATAGLVEVLLTRGEGERARALRDEIAADALSESGERYHDKLDKLLAEAPREEAR